MQRRVKTYGKRTTRIITVNESNTTDIISPTKHTAHVQTPPPSSDSDSPAEQRIPNQTRHKMEQRNTSKTRGATTLKANITTGGSTSTQLVKESIPRRTIDSTEKHILQKPQETRRNMPRASRTGAVITNSNDRNSHTKTTKISHRVVLSSNEDSSEDHSPPKQVRRPQQSRSNPKSRQVVLDTPDTSLQVDEGDILDLSDSEGNDSPAWSIGSSPKQMNSSLSRNRSTGNKSVNPLQGNPASALSPPRTPSPRKRPGKSAVDKWGIGAETSSDSDEGREVKHPHPEELMHRLQRPALPQRNTYTNMPQLKAMHLRKARPRQGTPLRRVPRFSLTSIVSLSSETVDIVPSPPKAKLLPTPRRVLDSSTSSPLTWDTTMTSAISRMQDLSLSDENSSSGSVESEASSPQALSKLLRIAGQTAPLEFAKFLDQFKEDDLETLSVQSKSAPKRSKTRTVQRTALKYRKIAEASYSEVYGIGDVVLKIIPLAAEVETIDSDSETSDVEEDGPFKSSPLSVLKEVLITRATGDTSDGFIKLLRLYVVNGKYPKALLKEWDEFKRERGSDSTRPDTFTEQQLHAIIVLPNAGIDLESYTFGSHYTPASGMGSAELSKSTSGKGMNVWRDAAEIFWQVASALAGAEEKHRFEHRDLHWGQIVVRKSTVDGGSQAKMTATIIDLGLSRVEIDARVEFSQIEDEVFTGRGIISNQDAGDDETEADYQFDVYRMMRYHNGNEWTEFRPLTNVMWLHYLSQKLLLAKGLRKPSTPARTSTIDGRNGSRGDHTSSEWAAYQHLKVVEEKLATRLQEVIDGVNGRQKAKGKPTKKQVTAGRKATVGHSHTPSEVQIESAGDVLMLWMSSVS